MDAPLLMIPGPSPPDPRVLEALTRPVQPHYGHAWGEFYERVVDDLRPIFATKGSVLLFPTPAQFVTEVGAVNLLEPGDAAVVVSSGFFSSQAEEVLTQCGYRYALVRPPVGRAAEADAVRRVFRRMRRAKALVAVHSETTTGVANRLRELGEVAQEQNAYFIVDAVSSFGGMPVDAERNSIDFCIGYASKALSGINGVVPVSVSERAWGRVEHRRKPIRSRYGSLRIWRKYIRLWGVTHGHPYPSSMPTNVIVALHEAVRLALEEGLENRYQRHIRASRAVRHILELLSLPPVAPDSEASRTVTVARVPRGLASRVLTLMREKHGIMIAGGMPPLEGQTVRIGHMGMSATERYLLPTLQALADVARELNLAPGVAAADKARAILAAPTA